MSNGVFTPTDIVPSSFQRSSSAQQVSCLSRFNPPTHTHLFSLGFDTFQRVDSMSISAHMSSWTSSVFVFLCCLLSLVYLAAQHFGNLVKMGRLCINKADWTWTGGCRFILTVQGKKTLSEALGASRHSIISSMTHFLYSNEVQTKRTDTTNTHLIC